MAKLAVTVTVTVTVTFFLLALCHARIPLDPSQNDAILPDPTPKTDIPSNEQPKSDESLTLVEWKPETTVSTESEPLTMVSFRPINHHFRPFPLTTRRGHGCRHHRRENHIHKFKPWGPRFPDHREVSYGNDMLVAREEDSGSDREFRGGAREMWGKFGHEDDEMHMKMRHHHHHHHHHHDGHVERDEWDREDNHEHEGGLMKRISKLLDMF